jgi:hypothetical protein
MIKNIIVCLFLFIIGCTNDSYVDDKIKNYSKLQDISLGESVDEVYKRFKKENFIIQHYKDISDLKECKNSKNVIFSNNMSNFDVNNNGILTEISTTNPNVVDANGIRVGDSEKTLENLSKNTKPEKVFSGDDSLDFFKYKILMNDKKGYFFYIVDNNKRITSITVSSINHINCYED